MLYVFIKPSLFLIIWIARKFVNHFTKLYKGRDIQLTFLLNNTIVTKFNLRKTPLHSTENKTNQLKQEISHCNKAIHSCV